MSTLPTVVILAGGENSRFFPLNQSTHKGALTILGKPLIVRTLENLEQNGFSDVVIVVSPKDYDGRGLSSFLAEYQFKLSIHYVLQPEAKGMGDALLCAKSRIKHAFATVYPTALNAGTQLHKLIAHAGPGGALGVAYTKEPWLYGIVTLEGKRVTSIEEKPTPGKEKSNLKQHGIHYLTHEFLAFLEETNPSEYSFETALDKYLEVFDVYAVEEGEPLPSLKYPWHLFDFQRVLLMTQPQYISPYAHVEKTAVLDSSMGPIYIENGARIGHCSKIVGPTYVGKDVFIGDFSLVRGSSFEEGSSIGAHSDVTRSILMERASMHSGFLGDSILGRDVKVGAGLITSNKRMDRKNIDVVVKGTKVNRGTNALGTVIGDGAQIGVRVNVMPGKFIGCRAVVYPALTVWDHVGHDAVLKSQ